jgi:hypothetical protein
VNNIDIHQLNLGPIRILEFLVEKLFKKCVLKHLFSNKCRIMFFWGKKPLSYEKGKDFINEFCINFSMFSIW